jgi:hypothetical protein
VANDAAWNAGVELAQKNIANRRERKEKLADEERKTKVTDLYAKGDALSKLIPSMSGERRDKAMSDLTSIEQSIADVYHPNSNPGALQKDWHWLSGMFGKKPQAAAQISTTTEPGSPSTNLQVSGSAVTLPGSTYNVSGPAGATTTSTTRDITLPAVDQSATGAAAPAFQRSTFTPATPYGRKQQEQRSAARKKAELDVAAAGLSPEEEAAVTGRKNLAVINQARKDFKAANPNATPAQEASFMADVIQKTYGVTQKPVYKEFLDPNGQKDWLDVTQPIPPGYTAVGAETTDTRKRADYAAYVKQHPEYEAQGGNFEKWTVTQNQLAKIETPTNRDDRFIALQKKKSLGQPLNADEQGFEDGYNMYINKRVTGPMLARVAAQAADRYVPFVDPSNPEQVIMMPVAEGAAAHLGTPQSIAFQTDKAMSKYMTSGKGGENINYFNTATEHLKLLGEAADALNNGDIQAVNKYGNAFATATGEEAPTDFETVKAAVAGELSKTFAGKSATESEIAQINQAIYSAESPAQLHGAINQALLLMQGKLVGMRKQWESGMTGRPAFPDESKGGGGAGKGGSSGGGNDMIMMKLPPDAAHPNGRTGPIHRSQKDQFIHDHPGSVEVTQ